MMWGRGGAVLSDNQRPSIWGRLLSAAGRPMPPEVAEYLLQLRLTKADDTRLEELADRCQLGTLPAAERQDYEELVQAGMLLSIWHAQARAALRAAQAAALG